MFLEQDQDFQGSVIEKDWKVTNLIKNIYDLVTKLVTSVKV